MIGRVDASQTRLREPWLSEMPQLVSQEAYGEGTETWRARTSTGAEVLARRLSPPSGMAPDDYLDRLRILHHDQPANLAPLAGGVERPDGIWVLARPIAAVPLQRLLDSGLELAPAFAIGMGVLQGLASLERAGLSQRVDTESILVDTLGTTRLEGPWLPSGSAPEPPVAAAGRLLCKILEMPVTPADTLSPAERQAPALAAAARSLAGGAIGEVISALALLSEAAGGLAAPAQVKRSAQVLAQTVRRLLSGQAVAQAGRASTPPPPAPTPMPAPPAARPPASTPAPAPPVAGSAPPMPNPVAPSGARPAPPMPNPVPPRQAPSPPMPDPVPTAGAGAAGAYGRTPPPMPNPAAARPAAAARPVPIGPRPNRESTWRAKPPPGRSRSGIAPVAVLAVAVLCLLLIVVAFIGFRALRGGTPIAATTPPTGQGTPPPHSQVTPPPGPPASAGDVQQVTLQLDQAQPCSPGDRACGLAVDVHLTHLLTEGEEVTWGFLVTDLCTGQTQTVDSPSAKVEAQQGWNHVTASSVIALPNAKRLQIVAATKSPAVAGSVPLTVGAPGC